MAALSAHRFTGLTAAGRVVAFRHEQGFAEAVREPIRLAVMRASRRFRSASLAFEAQKGPSGGTTSSGPRFAPVQAGALVDQAKLQADLAAAMRRWRVNVLHDTMMGVERHMSVSFDVTNPLLDKVLEEQGALQVQNITVTVLGEIQTSLEASRTAGLDVNAAAKALATASSSISVNRGVVIARTEITRVANGGSLALARITGAAPYKQWMTAPGARYPRHEEDDGLDGQTVPLDAQFSVNGYPADYPGDPNLPPEESINCRCSIGYTDEAS